MATAEISHNSTNQLEKAEKSKASRVFFPNLDGLRFIAFFLVFLQHGFGRLPNFLMLRNFPDIITIPVRKIFSLGGLGVSFFFVLSGFLITFLILTEIKQNGRLDVLSFYVRRTLRIWPLYYSVLLVAFFLYPAAKGMFGYDPYIESGHPIWYFTFLSNFDIMQHPDNNHGAMSTNITWSVAIEEQFYLAWPLLFFFIRPKQYRYIFPSVILLSFIFRVLNHGNGMVLYYHSLSVIGDMALGGMLAYVWLQSPKFRTFVSKMSTTFILSVYLFGLMLIFYGERIFQIFQVPGMDRLMYTLFFGFIIAEQNFATNSLLKMSRLSAITYWGKYTYGLYLLHPLAIQLTIVIWRLTAPSSDGLIKTIVMGGFALIVSLVCSFASYYWFENKFLKLKNRFTRI